MPGSSPDAPGDAGGRGCRPRRLFLVIPPVFLDRPTGEATPNDVGLFSLVTALRPRAPRPAFGTGTPAPMWCDLLSIGQRLGAVGPRFLGPRSWASVVVRWTRRWRRRSLRWRPRWVVRFTRFETWSHIDLSRFFSDCVAFRAGFAVWAGLDAVVSALAAGRVGLFVISGRSFG